MQQVHPQHLAAITFRVLTAALISFASSSASGLQIYTHAIATPNESYLILYYSLDPANGDYITHEEAQVIADALDSDETPSPGSPNGYHAGYRDKGFVAPAYMYSNTVVIDDELFCFGAKRGCAIPLLPLQLDSTNIRDRTNKTIRKRSGHELFHYIQMAYIGFGIDLEQPQVFDFAQTVGFANEGTARLMEDKIYTNLDGWDSDANTYLNEVADYLSDPSRHLWDLSYESALFWNYLSEQFGTDTVEPGYGVDFIRTFWENGSTAKPDVFTMIETTLADFGVSKDMRTVFQEFNIANLVREFDYADLSTSEQAKYSYVDERDGNLNDFGSQLRYADLSIETPTIELTNSSEVSDVDAVRPWGAKYFKADVFDCRGLVGFTAEAGGDCGTFFRCSGDTLAYSLVGVKKGLFGGSPRREKRVIEVVSGGLGVSTKDEFAAAFVQDHSDPYESLYAVAVGVSVGTTTEISSGDGWSDLHANFEYSFACGEPSVAIEEPTGTYPAYVGDESEPERFLTRVNVTGPPELGSSTVQGLSPTDFRVYVGTISPGDQATILSGAYVRGQYWLTVQAPMKVGSVTPQNLYVELAGASAVFMDTRSRRSYGAKFARSFPRAVCKASPYGCSSSANASG